MTVDNNTSETRCVSTQYDSLREFFISLPYGTIVTVGEYGAEFIYTGDWKYNSDNEIELTVFRTMVKHYVDVDDPNQVWKVVKDDNGNRCVDNVTLRALNELRWRTRDAETARTVLAEETARLDARIEKLRNDFQQLNTLMNEYADQERMCGDYESKLEEWNESLSNESNLVGRKRDRCVRVRMTRTWDVWLDVEATSESEAREIMENKDADEVASLVTAAQSWPDTCELVVRETTTN